MKAKPSRCFTAFGNGKISFTMISCIKHVNFNFQKFILYFFQNGKANQLVWVDSR